MKRNHLRGMLRLVVARYTEDLSWIDRVDPLWHRTVITKGQQIPNVGRVASTYLWAMENVCYEDDGWVCFVQGNPFDHYDGLYQALNDPMQYPLQFLPLGRSYAMTDADGAPHDSGVPVRDFWERLIGPWPTTDDGLLQFAPGAQFIVPAAYIRGKTKDEIREARELVESHEAGAHAMERIWDQWVKF